MRVLNAPRYEIIFKSFVYCFCELLQFSYQIQNCIQRLNPKFFSDELLFISVNFPLQNTPQVINQDMVG